MLFLNFVGMSAALNTTQKKELAKLLFLQNQYTQKYIAEKVQVQEKTIGRWVKDENWDKLRKSMLTTKTEVLRTLYDILDNLKNKVSKSEDGIGDTKLADMIVKYTAAIKNLETETSVAQIVEVSRMYVNWLLTIDPAQAQITVNNLDGFIKEKIKAF